jgi:hypothetical protein
MAPYPPEKTRVWLDTYASDDIDLDVMLEDLEEREILDAFRDWYDMYFGEEGLVTLR